MQNRQNLKAYLIQDEIISKTQVNLYERYSRSSKKIALFSIVEYYLTYEKWPGYPFWQPLPGTLPTEAYHEGLKKFDEIVLYFTCSQYSPEPSEENWQKYKLNRKRLMDAGLNISNLFISVERDDDLGDAISKEQIEKMDIQVVTSCRSTHMYRKYGGEPMVGYIPVASVTPNAQQMERMITFGV